MKEEIKLIDRLKQRISLDRIYLVVNPYKDKEATLSNLKLLLGSSKMSLFGDPYYGTNLKKLTMDLLL